MLVEGGREEKGVKTWGLLSANQKSLPVSKTHCPFNCTYFVPFGWLFSMPLSWNFEIPAPHNTLGPGPAK